MKNNTDNIPAGTAILYSRGSLSFEGRVIERFEVAGIVGYSVERFAPGGGPPTGERVDITADQVQRVFA